MNHIKDLHPDKRNARKHTPRNIGMIADSLNEVGAARSIVIDEDGNILAGNGTVEAAAQAGITQVQVVEADGNTIIAVQRKGLTKKQKQRLALYDNRTAELAEWEPDVLAELDSEDVLDGMFTDDEISSIIGDAESPAADQDAEPQIDRAEELREKWDVKSGQLWQLGEHRLLCGDSTDAADVAILMRGEESDLLFTSPPYSDARDYKGGNLDPSHLSSFLRTFRARLYCVNLGIIRKNGELLTYWDSYIETAKSCGLSLLSWNVWDRGISKSVGQKTAMFPIEHEFIFVFGERAFKLTPTVPNPGAGQVRKPTNRQKDGSVVAGKPKIVRDKREIGTVYRGGVISDSSNHPAMFPVEFPAEYIAACTSHGGIVAEPFCGSGTTVIACEQLGRKCRAIEISPAYVAVTLQRYYDAFGVMPILI